MRLIAAAPALLPALLAAQITIGPADMPSAGDTVRYRTAPALGLDPAPTEAGFIWDFGMLDPGMEGADTCVTVASTPLAYQLFFNNPFLYPQHQASYAVRGQGFSFQVLNVEDVVDYFKKDAQGFRNVGFGANVNGVPTSTRRLPVDWVHRFPLEYGDMDTSFSTFTLSIPTLFSFTQEQTRYNHVDGWGTLYLPADTFEVLRVKSVLQRTDSAYIEQLGQGFNFPEPETIEYKWIAQGMDGPVLIITTVAGQPATARFHYSPEEGTVGMGARAPERLRVWPNPATHEAWITVPADADGRLEVRDLQGRLALTARMTPGTARIGLSGLAPGPYAIALGSARGAFTTRLVVQ
ncbi:MAG: T9SS type A sorting domain-containing protein [Flavobacteriales bacterium]